MKTNQQLKQLKAGARHNRWDRATLDKMVQEIFELGGICPYCGNGAGHDDEEDSKAEKASRASTHIVVPSDHPAAVIHEQVRSRIAEQDLAEFGIEDFPHITVKYGFDDTDLAAVREIIELTAPFTVTFGAAQMFSRPDFDVLYIQAESQGLRELNAKLTPVGDPPNWPGYTPHLTVAYVLPQNAAKYLPIDSFVGMELTVRSIEFSSSENEATTIELRGSNMPFNGMSYEAIKDLLRNAWEKYTRDRFAVKYEKSDFYSYICATWTNRVAVYFDGSYYEVPYAVLDGDDVVFAGRDRWTEVERLEVWVAKHAEYLKSIGVEESTAKQPSEEAQPEPLVIDSAEELAKSFLPE